jgi:hypothetical protein
MTAAELLQGLKARGATVAANGDRLKLSARDSEEHLI